MSYKTDLEYELSWICREIEDSRQIAIEHPTMFQFFYENVYDQERTDRYINLVKGVKENEIARQVYDVAVEATTLFERKESIEKELEKENSR